MTQDIHIALSGITKGYRIGGDMIPIFSGLNLAIPCGDFVAVILRIGSSRLDQMGEGARASWRAHHMGIVSSSIICCQC